jgi:hypothetical protein
MESAQLNASHIQDYSIVRKLSNYGSYHLAQALKIKLTRRQIMNQKAFHVSRRRSSMSRLQRRASVSFSRP